MSHLLVRPERIATLLLTTWLATWLSPLLADDSLPSWRHTATRQRILAFIREVTTPGSPSFVAPPARIAVFDNDGTLWTEQPVYVQLRYSMHRATHLVKTHPTWQDKEPFRSALTGGFKAMLSDGQLFTRLTEVTLGNITVSALHKDVLRWLSTSRHARFDRLYTDLTYQPMLELLALLRLHGFKNYIVSGGDTEFLRAWAPAAYGIPAERIIGSQLVATVTRQNGKTVKSRQPQLEFFNNRDEKPIRIQAEVGRRPLIAIGNSDGDYEMLSWTTSAKRPGLGVLIHHTDKQREYAYDRKSPIGRLDKGLNDAKRRRWVIVDMKKDWARVFPDRRAEPLTGKRSDFHGFRQFDFSLRDDQGHDVACRVVTPRKPATGRPWIWRARFWAHEPQADLALLARGFHLVYCDVANLWGNTEAIRRWDLCYHHLTTKHGLSRRPALEGMSRGGLMIYHWAIRHPDRVSCIYGDAPAMGIRPYVVGRQPGSPDLKKLAAWMAAHKLTLKAAQSYRHDALDTARVLARAGVPVIHVCGDADESVPFEEHTAEFARRYRKWGGTIKVIVKKGGKHHPHSLKDPTPIVEFIVNAQSPRPRKR